MAVAAITYPLDLPSTPAPVSTKFELRAMVGAASSPFSGVAQVQDWGGRVWMATVVLPVMLRATADAWIAWAMKLRGQYGYFRMGDWDRRTPRGSWGTPLVNGGSQVGNTLVVDGMGAAGTGKAGDHFQLENNLYALVEDVTADGSGNATLTFEPSLRASPADNAALTVSSPKGLFRLIANSVPWDADAMAVHQMSFQAVERLS